MHDDFNLDDAVAMLKRTPASLNALLLDLPERWARATEGDDSWSPYDVVVHLIHGEHTNWMPRARHILAGERRPFDPFDRMGQLSESQAMSMGALLATFAELRRENIAALTGLNLTSADLRRTGQHPEFGTVRLEQLLATWVVHDLNHLGQIVRALAKVHTAAVGPWVAYLAILQERE
jgi:hypothetical protein